MQTFDRSDLKKLYIPPSDSHKGQNGKLLFIGGSHLFHAASLWALTIASRIVDMVFYASVPENNKIVQEAKQEFRNGIVIPRHEIESYADEADCILIGPGMVRTSREQVLGSKYQVLSMREINTLENEGEQTYFLTKYLLEKYPKKKWVIDGGALQMMDPSWLSRLTNVVLTPHQREFHMLFGETATPSVTQAKAEQYNCIILVKGTEDIVCSKDTCVKIPGGNAGMTKGGTGDVMAGLVAALACKNDLFLATKAGSYITKKAGEQLYTEVGYYFNASDLADEIPAVLKQLLL